MSGFGVRPARYSRRNSANTRSLYSVAKLTCSSSMPITSATAAASTKSMFDEQYSVSSSSSQFFMKMPTTSWPARLSSQAATAESTPPDRPTTTRDARMSAAPGRPKRLTRPWSYAVAPTAPSGQRASRARGQTHAPILVFAGAAAAAGLHGAMRAVAERLLGAVLAAAEVDGRAFVGRVLDRRVRTALVRAVAERLA